MARSPTAIEVMDLAGNVVGILEIIDGLHDVLDPAVAVEQRE